MFTETRAVFFHCVSPVHMGSGTALGIVDNPIQRERHSHFPVFAGSGIKGALRHHVLNRAVWDKPKLEAIFGPESERGSDQLHAGAISFTDAQLVCFPARSAKNAFAYITCPLALATAQRLLRLSGLPCAWTIPNVKENEAVCASESLGKPSVALELFDFPTQVSPAAQRIAEDLAGFMPKGEEWTFFRNKLKTDLLVLHDTDFTYFARNATSVEPHVSIENDTGAADGGKLFYTENLPPESILLGLLLASKTRVRKSKEGGPAIQLDAGQVAESATTAAEGLLQIGGDATTGRGQVVLTFPASGAQQ